MTKIEKAKKIAEHMTKVNDSLSKECLAKRLAKGMTSRELDLAAKSHGIQF